ncbi:MAG: hypothetical protein GY906_38560 [bacterium]|nr:hypothetical protein [bacterium]
MDKWLVIFEVPVEAGNARQAVATALEAWSGQHREKLEDSVKAVLRGRVIREDRRI